MHHKLGYSVDGNLLNLINLYPIPYNLKPKACGGARTLHDDVYKKLGYSVDDQLLLNELITGGDYWPTRATGEDPAVVWGHGGQLRLHFLPALLFANGAGVLPLERRAWKQGFILFGFVALNPKPEPFWPEP